MLIVELGRTKVTRGKEEYHWKPNASALGVTVDSDHSPTQQLLIKLLELGKTTEDEVVQVVRGAMRVWARDFTVAEWIDGRAMGVKPGSRPWLHKKDD